MWHCGEGTYAPVACQKCEYERKETEKRARKAAEAQKEREAKTQKHLKEVAKLQEQIEKVTQGMKDKRLDDEHAGVLAQMKKDLAAAQQLANRTQTEHSTPEPSATQARPARDFTTPAPTIAAAAQPASTPNPSTSTAGKKTLKDHLKTCLVHNVSASKTEWQRQKDQENANNPAIDKIMEMIGLEDVKSQVLRIKSKVDTSIRQGTDLKKERLGLTLLGNPGTGRFLCCFKSH